MKDSIKWGVIGSGGIARRRTIPEGIIPAGNAKLISVYDIDLKVNALVAKEFYANAVNSVEELVNSDIDAVYVASPVNLHVVHVLAAAKAKKHVFCEKALGLSVEEAEKMTAVCNREGVLFGTGFMMRFLSQHQAALKLIKQGDIGKPLFCRAQLSCWYPPIQ